MAKIGTVQHKKNVLEPMPIFTKQWLTVQESLTIPPLCVLPWQTSYKVNKEPFMSRDGLQDWKTNWQTNYGNHKLIQITGSIHM